MSKSPENPVRAEKHGGMEDYNNCVETTKYDSHDAANKVQSETKKANESDGGSSEY